MGSGFRPFMHWESATCSISIRAPSMCMLISPRSIYCSVRVEGKPAEPIRIRGLAPLVFVAVVPGCRIQFADMWY